MTELKSSRAFDIIVVGHITIDQIKYGDGTRKEIGGSSAFAMVGPALGLKRVGVVARVGKDFPEPYMERLSSSGLDLEGLTQNNKTTHFTNIYNEQGDRRQRVDSVANKLTKRDVPDSYWNTTWMHFSPVIGEVDSALISDAKEHGAKISVDVQGFVRTQKKEDTTIEGCDWEEFPKYAEMIEILKADTQELCQLAQKSEFRQAANSIHQLGVHIILITRGYKGSYLSLRNGLHRIPIIPVKQVIDHTGSGDVFAISFLREYETSNRPLWSAYFAATVASFNLESPGPTNFPSYEEVLHRLRAFLTLPKNREHIELLLNEPGPGNCPI
ncbi:MAG: carbohydrate kinase family protein [Promethearchaeota archaeon]